MVDNQKKRKLPAAPANASAKKRRTASATKKAGPKSVAKPKRVLEAGSLKWKTVDIPEMFNDAEGFYGLEEVTGVEVVRSGNLVKFVTAADASDDDEEFQGFDDETELPNTADVTQGDEDSNALPEPDVELAPKTDGKKKLGKQAEKKQEKKISTTQPKENKDEKNKKKKKAGTAQPEKDNELESNVFTSVGDAATEDAAQDVDMSSWISLDLSPQLVSSLARLKFAKPTAIQSATIPKILAGHDVIGKASTGSGKTLAFSIPVVEAWLLKQEEGPEEDKSPMGLIMSPTRELAHQIANHIKELCAGLPTAPYICSVTGGLSVHKQQRQLEKADIVVGTPGRLWEVLSASKTLLSSFRKVSFLVVDEADRLLTEGHFKEAEEILKAIDRIEVDEDDDEPELFPRQTLVFSATFNKGLQQKLAGKGNFNLMSDAQSMEYLLKKLNFREEKPKFVDVNPVSQMAQGLKEGLVECGAMEKDLYLYSLLLLHPTQRTLVFTNSISSVRRLLPMLQNLNLPVHALHSQMPQKARLRSVERFTGAKPGTASILVATDVAARGLDIKGIDVIIHYHVPRAADAYVHRSGRTARAENSGLSVLLCAPEEVVSTRRLIAKVHASAKLPASARKTDFFIRTIDIDRRLVNRLKDRVTLAKKIADTQLAKEKGNKDDDWMKNAAEELGVDYDSEEMDKMGKWAGRGSGRKAKQDEARGLSKAEVGVLRAQLRELLSKRVNSGVSERYIASGNMNIDELLKGSKGEFLGNVDGLDLDD